MHRLLTAAVTAALLFTGCAIREDPVPRAISEEDQANFGEIATGDVAEGGGRIYLVSPSAPDAQPQLRAVSRNEPANPQELLRSLVLGANPDESALGLSSAIPTDLEIIGARTVGTRLTIDINDALDELSDQGLRQALAQIVATASSIDQVQLVRLRVDGEPQVWPTGDGEGTDQPLSIYDYPGFLETSQPDFTAPPSA
ncbi:MAG: GerMN domain-containing protein [Ilumatobacter sp.]|uniref:GerMN domain-containing protein n=1 Tax=Ilumatobacter sp. TaxID=1967498 RepID=UPI003C755F31